MKEVIWFFGSSTAGKKTLIDKILTNPDLFREKFGIEAENIKAMTWTPNFGHLVEVDIMKKVII